MAGTCKGEPAHGKEAVERFLLGLLQESFNTAKFPIRTLHRSPLRKLHRKERNTLVFSRHEACRKLDEADHHGGDHNGVTDNKQQRMMNEASDGVANRNRQRFETAVKPTEEASLAHVMFMVH